MTHDPRADDLAFDALADAVETLPVNDDIITPEDWQVAVNALLATFAAAGLSVVATGEPPERVEWEWDDQDRAVLKRPWDQYPDDPDDLPLYRLTEGNDRG